MVLCASAYLKKCAHFSDFRSCLPLDSHRLPLVLRSQTTSSLPILYAESSVREEGWVWSRAYTVLFCATRKLGSLLCSYYSDNDIHKNITQVTVKG